MSSQRRPLPPIEVPLDQRSVAECMCASGFECSSFGAGHALHLIQTRLAAATPGDWVDAVVESADAATGVITLRTFADGLPVAIWNGAGAAGAVEIGSPVALHARYHVLSAGRDRYNIRVGG